jgi:hypothetical protein
MIDIVRDIQRSLAEQPITASVPCDWYRNVKVEGGPINVVFFHVDGAGSHPFSGGERVDYMAVLASAVAASRRALTDCAVIVLTDERSDVSGRDVRIVRVPANPAEMMYTRMRAYRALVQSGCLTGPTLFLDTDVILNRNFAKLFDGGFDIGLTYRDDLAMPFNEGVILAAKGNAPQTLQFFSESLALYERIATLPSVRSRYNFNVKKWRGGQLSLGALLGWYRPAANIQTVELRGVRYRLFPCDGYNYAVQDGDSRETLASKWALHFKGPGAKSVMPTP